MYSVLVDRDELWAMYLYDFHNNLQMVSRNDRTNHNRDLFNDCKSDFYIYYYINSLATDDFREPILKRNLTLYL